MKPMKFITEDTFKVHKGLDLANLSNQEDLISALPVMKILKTTPFNHFKQKVAVKYEKQPEQIHFWAFGPRQNKTVRPDILISSDYFNLTMDEICAKLMPYKNTLYLEIADKPLIDNTWFPSPGGKSLVFLKFFDPCTQTLDSSTDGGTHSEKSDDGGDDVAIGSLNCRRARKTLKYGDDNVIDINPINERNTSRDLSESVEGSVEEYEDLKFLIGTNFNVIFLPDLNESDEEDVNGLVNEILI
ncbi:18771_t:CDS:2 [Entrophospora sp. SA101]|nr:18771_t:CDS:2 [Entrophospora sp. SA101]CAJ0823652.1 10889_t:CDS:2 [Entrophospora sp. SA101]CAJ0829191.1 18607_t:CDS:2 [Entrophospora sp. SA101]